MGSVTVAARGPVAPETAWERYLYPAQWATWAPHISRVSASTPVLRPGTTGTVTALGVLPAHFEVLSVDEETRSWSWRVHVGPVELVLHHGLSASRGGGATAAHVSMTGPWPILLAYRPLMRWAMRRLVR